ncbi:MAG: bifunctional proline dehydrogenase/L-glutamate gamma-semialdehyde dehydrogenase [Planctomycetaceae bacterium]|nr:bifunctional proline dehydrogenase/L-glutamate gamma-semialdehyde dehydrogenase [Planctomycetaceae bacterium]
MAQQLGNDEPLGIKDLLLSEFGVESGKALDQNTRIQRAAALAAFLQSRANELLTSVEKEQQEEFDKLIRNPADRATLVQMTDQVFRSSSLHRSADQLVHILDVQGIPGFFSPFDKLMLQNFKLFGSFLPSVSMPLVKKKMRHETSNVVLPAETEHLNKHLADRRVQGIRMNVNLLGESLIGEKQSLERIESYQKALRNPALEVLSVKISTLYSQINHLARESTIAVVAARMQSLFEIARDEIYQGEEVNVSKMVYLDMEEFRDMSITFEAFVRALSAPGFEQARSGIALQTYIPDSFGVQKQLVQWALQRVANGGAVTTVRLVKGANLEMERVDASLRGWPQSPFKTKLQTDANYKRMLDYALQPQHARAVNVGVASHNLLDIAYAMVLATERDVLDCVQFEMLEGMANHLRRAMSEHVDNILLYAPACKKEKFINAIGYLVRRLDENTGASNFLRYAFHLKPGSANWVMLRQKFIESFELISHLPIGSRRTQNRTTEVFESTLDNWRWDQLVNEPDTDFSLPDNARWAQEIIASGLQAEPRVVTPIIAGEEDIQATHLFNSTDPSRPTQHVGTWTAAEESAIDLALKCADVDETSWRKTTAKERSAILRDVANEIRRSRRDLIEIALAEGGKLILEADAEVSEAVDFVEFYRKSVVHIEEMQDLSASPRGMALVISPWNFPIATPPHGIAIGNTVILKPSSETVLTARRLCECFWEAGVSKKVLQFAPCRGAAGGVQLTASDKVDSIIFTGSTAAAKLIQQQTPRARLLAETGGKNTTIVTVLSDREQAVKHVLHSAFGHSGQKCSATSLLILEKGVYEDEAFLELLRDAASSLTVGSAWQLETRIGPLINPPSGDLYKALLNSEEGESWLLEPRIDKNNKCLVSPGIKMGVTANSFVHRTELFGPILGVMLAESLEHAVTLANETGYGLTAGIETLDDREQEYWKANIVAGNLYVNRPTTGAIVLRQPFGGFGASSIGAGIKAGGPNYVTQLMKFRTWLIDVTADLKNMHNQELAEFGTTLLEARRSDIKATAKQIIIQALTSYDEYAHSEYNRVHDHFHLIGQDNIRRYLPVEDLVIRVTRRDEAYEIVLRMAAAHAVGARVMLSHAAGVHEELLQVLIDFTRHWKKTAIQIVETDGELLDRVARGEVSRVRYAQPSAVEDDARRVFDEHNVVVMDAPVLVNGRIELLWNVREQSVSDDYHRYGNLGKRAIEIRVEPL